MASRRRSTATSNGSSLVRSCQISRSCDEAQSKDVSALVSSTLYFGLQHLFTCFFLITAMTKHTITIIPTSLVRSILYI